MLLPRDVRALSIVAMKTAIMEEMRDALIPLLQVEDGAADGTVTENVGVILMNICTSD